MNRSFCEHIHSATLSIAECLWCVQNGRLAALPKHTLAFGLLYADTRKHAERPIVLKVLRRRGPNSGEVRQSLFFVIDSKGALNAKIHALHLRVMATPRIDLTGVANSNPRIKMNQPELDPFDLASCQTYFDETTNHPLELCFDKHQLNVDGVVLTLEGVPLLKNPVTGVMFFPAKVKAHLSSTLSEAKARREATCTVKFLGLGDKRYQFAIEVNFLYSSIDYEYIPGLIRPWDKGFLTPVFFNSAVLNKYAKHPKFRVDLFAESYGSVRHVEGEWSIEFGINRSGKIIAWLGDLDKLPLAEQYFWRSENVESDHDIHSEFYDGQIEVQFAEPSRESAALGLRNELIEAVQAHHGFELFVLQGEVDKVIDRLHRPVFWDSAHVDPVIGALNQIFVESLNSDGLKKAIVATAPTLDLKGRKGLKLMQEWLAIAAPTLDARQLLSPFFVLYDLRILASHLVGGDSWKDSLKTVNERLGLPSGNDSLEAIYMSLLSGLVASIRAILDVQT